jgi:hypothetical protein
VIRDEGAGFGDDDGDDMGDEFEGNADIADINRDEQASEDENIDDELDFRNKLVVAKGEDEVLQQ